MQPSHLLALAGVLAVTATAGVADAQNAVPGVKRLDPALDALIPADAKVERLAEGFAWSEGPVWRKKGGYLLFTDIPNNTIHRWKEGEGLSIFLRPSGLAAGDPPGREVGSNGLTFDAEGRLVMADHGNRQVAALDEKNYTKVPLAERYEGKRFNSPNDVVYHSNGDLYFTDPPYGLADLNKNPKKELPFNGVYRLSRAGKVTLLVHDLTFPNGVAFSPDEKTLYVTVSDPERAVIMAYDVTEAGVANGRVFFDATPLVKAGGKGLPDGIKVDRAGNVFSTGPGGVLVLSPRGKHLGTIETGEATANCAFGDDGSTLYMTAHRYLMRVRLSTRGATF